MRFRPAISANEDTTTTTATMRFSMRLSMASWLRLPAAGRLGENEPRCSPLERHSLAAGGSGPAGRGERRAGAGGVADAAVAAQLARGLEHRRQRRSGLREGLASAKRERHLQRMSREGTVSI